MALKKTTPLNGGKARTADRTKNGATSSNEMCWMFKKKATFDDYFRVSSVSLMFLVDIPYYSMHHIVN